MNEALRLEIVQRRQSGMSLRAIAEELGLSHRAVARTLAHVQAQRDGRSPGPVHATSIIDPFEPLLKELLAKYPNLTTMRLLEELQARGFTGQYTVVLSAWDCCGHAPRSHRAALRDRARDPSPNGLRRL